MTKTTLTVALCASFALNLGTLGAIAFHTFSPHGHGEATEAEHDGAAQLSERDLSLSADQAAAFERVRTAVQRRIDATTVQMQEHRKGLLVLLAQTPPDRAAIDRVVADISTTQLNIQRAVVDQWVQQQEVLTPEQHSRFLQLLGNRLGGEEHGEAELGEILNPEENHEREEHR